VYEVSGETQPLDLFALLSPDDREELVGLHLQEAHEPTEWMKTGQENRILPDRALAVLEEAQAFADGSGLMFPSPRGRRLSNATITMVRDLGSGAVPHGFRSNFEDLGQILATK